MALKFLFKLSFQSQCLTLILVTLMDELYFVELYAEKIPDKPWQSCQNLLSMHLLPYKITPLFLFRNFKVKLFQGRAVLFVFSGKKWLIWDQLDLNLCVYRK